MLNLHVYPSPIVHESRIQRETHSLVKANLFSQVEVAGTLIPGLPDYHEFPEGAAIRRFSSGPKSGRTWARVGKALYFGRNVYRHYRRAEIAAITCHSVSVLPLCSHLKRSTGAILVYSTHELETETTSARGLKRVILKIIERLFISQVDHTFAVTEAISQWYRDAYSLSNVDTMYNFPVQAQAPDDDEAIDLRGRLGILSDEPIFLYQGLLSSGRGLETIADAFESEQIPGVVVFVGYGQLESELRRRAEKSLRIYVHEAISPSELTRFTRGADVGLIVIPTDSCLSYRYSAGNKLFQYLSAGLPIIASDLQEHRRFLERYSAGVLLKDGSVETMIECARSMSRSCRDQYRESLARIRLELDWASYDDLLESTYRRLLTSKR